MGPLVIAISRQFGSGGARIGRAVAQRLGLQYADREILAEAARVLKVEPGDLESLEERGATFWTRVGALFALGSPDVPFVPPALPTVTAPELLDVEQRIITRIVNNGGAVIVGRGAAHMRHLSDRVCRVFLHAPVATRIDVALSEYALADREAAAALVHDSDRARAKFVRGLTGRDWLDATMYDLCIDVGSVGIERAGDLIVELVQRQSAAPHPSSPPTADSQDRR